VAVHELKTWPTYYGDVKSGKKPFELRQDDRPFEVGDALYLREWDPETGAYTGRQTYRLITYILRPDDVWGIGISEGFAILGLGIPEMAPDQREDHE
jgi:hypothetical protein